MFKNLKLSSKIMLVVSCILLTMFGGLNAYLLVIMSKNYKSSSEQILKEQAKLKATKVIMVLHSVGRTLKNFSAYLSANTWEMKEPSTIQAMLTKIVESSQDVYIRQAFLILLNNDQVKSSVEVIRTAEGKTLSFSNTPSIMHASAVEQTLKKRHNTRDLVKVTTLLDGTKAFGTTIVVPIKVNDKAVALVGVFVDFASIQNDFFPKGNMDGFMIGSDDSILAIHRDHSLQGRQFSDVMHDARTKDILDFRKNARSGTISIIEWHSSVLQKDTIATLYAFTPFDHMLSHEGYNWVVGAVFTKDKVFSELYQIRRVIIVGGIVTFIATMFILYFYMRLQVVQRLNSMLKMLMGFFSLLRHERTSLDLSRARYNDEIGVMRNALCDNIARIQKNFEIDNYMVGCATLSATSLEKGIIVSKDLECQNGATPQICELVSTLCAMIASLEKNVGSDLN
ncbi:chemotaxis protein, partial [Helicobacter baculiformis]